MKVLVRSFSKVVILAVLFVLLLIASSNVLASPATPTIISPKNNQVESGSSISYRFFIDANATYWGYWWQAPNGSTGYALYPSAGYCNNTIEPSIKYCIIIWPTSGVQEGTWFWAVESWEGSPGALYNKSAPSALAVYQIDF